MAHLCISRPQLKTILKRDWRNYTKERLVSSLELVDWSINANCVQEMWDAFEHKLINVVDSIVPVAEFKNEHFVNKPCPRIKHKLNLRKRLLKIQRERPSLELKIRIKSLNFEIKTHFYSDKRKKVRSKILPGNSKSLWDAVKVAHVIFLN